MAGHSFGDQIYSLQNATNGMSNSLNCGSGWDDDVHRSYEGFLSQEENAVRGLEYDLAEAEQRINAAMAVNTSKYRSQLNAYRARLQSI